jgi:hypothetical protein
MRNSSSTDAESLLRTRSSDNGHVRPAGVLSPHVSGNNSAKKIRESLTSVSPAMQEVALLGFRCKQESDALKEVLTQTRKMIIERDKKASDELKVILKKMIDLFSQTIIKDGEDLVSTIAVPEAKPILEAEALIKEG